MGQVGCTAVGYKGSDSAVEKVITLTKQTLSSLLHNFCKLLEVKDADWQVLSEDSGNENMQQHSLSIRKGVKSHEKGRRKVHIRFQTFLKIKLFSLLVELLVELPQSMQIFVKMSNTGVNIQ